MIVMILGGLWHGAAWSYAVWGLMHGLALVVERMFSKKIKRPPTLWIITLKRCLVFSFVTLAWLLFRLPKFAYVLVYLNSLIHNTTLVIDPDIVHIALYSSPVFLYHLLYVSRAHPIVRLIKRYDFVIYASLIFFIVLNSGPVSPFIYFQF